MIAPLTHSKIPNAAKLEPSFFSSLYLMGRRHHTNPAVWLAVWTAESELNPAIVSPVPPHARGLNQMIPSTLATLGAPAAFERLSGTEQLVWIERLISDGERRIGGPFKSSARYYHFNFLPETLHRGTDPDAVIAAKDAASSTERAAYNNNQGLDPSKRGAILGKDLMAYVDGAKRSQEFMVAIQRLNAAATAPEELPNVANFAGIVAALGSLGVGALVLRGRNKWSAQ